MHLCGFLRLGGGGGHVDCTQHVVTRTHAYGPSVYVSIATGCARLNT